MSRRQPRISKAIDARFAEKYRKEREEKAELERRTALCLDACKGISTDALEAGVVGDAIYYLCAAMEWIDAVPDDVAEALPTMPGFDRDKLNDVLSLLEKSDE